MSAGRRAARQYLLLAGIVALCGVPSLVLRLDARGAMESFSEPKYRWIASRVREHGTRVRMAMVGSSYLWVALDGKRIVEELYDGEPWRAINLGVNWHGRGRDALVLREVLPLLEGLDTLVLGVVTDRPRQPVHPNFFRLASLPEVFDDPIFDASTCSELDVAESATFFSRAFLEGLVGGYVEILERTRLGFDLWTRNQDYDDHYGSLIHDRVMSGQPKIWFERPREVRGCERDIGYLRRMAAAARARSVRVVFVELPIGQAPPLSPTYVEVLRGLGTFMELGVREELMSDMRYWHNTGHLNREGNRLYTDWFIDEMRERQ